jgi:hypothetical protein
MSKPRPIADSEGTGMWFTPTHRALLGLAVGVAGVTLLGSLSGAEVKKPFWMAFDKGLIVVVAVVACAVVIWAVSQTIRRRRLSRLALPLPLSGVLLILVAGVLIPAHRRVKEDIALVNEHCGFTDALVGYVVASEGKCPGSLDDLIQGGFIQKGADGKWFVTSSWPDHPSILRDPTWFDVAWGIHARQLSSTFAVMPPVG